MTPHRRIRVLSAAAVALLGALLYFCLRETGRLKLPAGSNVPQISMGYSHGLVIAPDGTLWSWGQEDLGFPVLGLGQMDGVPAFSPLLRQISSDTNWTKVSAGQDHNLALKSDGSIWTWGTNDKRQMGIRPVGPIHQSSLVPSVPGTNWLDVEAGTSCSYALKTDGSLWAWGLNDFGQLGTDSARGYRLFGRVGSATNWTKIRAGGTCAAGIQSDGSLWIWGGCPPLGSTPTNSLRNPRRMTSDTNWVDVSVEDNIWLAVKADGTLWAFGKVAHIYTGAPPSAFAMPIQIGTNSDWLSVRSSEYGMLVGMGARYGLLLRKRDGSFWNLSVPGFTPGPPFTPLPARLQRLDLPTGAVAGDIGGGTAAVVTIEGEVWALGTVLGERASNLWLRRWMHDLRLGKIVRTPAQPVRDHPWRIRNIPPEDPPK